MKRCSYCGKDNEDTAPACGSCGNDLQIASPAVHQEDTSPPTERFHIRQISSDWSCLFRALLIVSTTSFLITFFHYYFVSDHLADALSWHGYGAILTLPTSIPWLAMLLLVASALGMWLFAKSARFLYTALLFFFVFLLFLSGVNVGTAFGSFFEALTYMSDGAVLVIAYFSPLKNRFQ